MYRAMEKETQAGGKGWTVRNAISDLFEELDGRAFWAGVAEANADREDMRAERAESNESEADR